MIIFDRYYTTVHWNRCHRFMYFRAEIVIQRAIILSHRGVDRKLYYRNAAANKYCYYFVWTNIFDNIYGNYCNLCNKLSTFHLNIHIYSFQLNSLHRVTFLYKKLYIFIWKYLFKIFISFFASFTDSFSFPVYRESWTSPSHLLLLLSPSSIAWYTVIHPVCLFCIILHNSFLPSSSNLLVEYYGNSIPLEEQFLLQFKHLDIPFDIRYGILVAVSNYNFLSCIYYFWKYNEYFFTQN